MEIKEFKKEINDIFYELTNLSEDKNICNILDGKAGRLAFADSVTYYNIFIDDFEVLIIDGMGISMRALNKLCELLKEYKKKGGVF